MGLAILPSRLVSELDQLADAIVNGKDIRANEAIEKHADWVDEFKGKYEKIDDTNVMKILQDEVGLVFSQVLEHAGVYKRDEKGQAAFDRFTAIL